MRQTRSFIRSPKIGKVEGILSGEELLAIANKTGKYPSQVTWDDVYKALDLVPSLLQKLAPLWQKGSTQVPPPPPEYRPYTGPNTLGSNSTWLVLGVLALLAFTSFND